VNPTWPRRVWVRIVWLVALLGVTVGVVVLFAGRVSDLPPGYAWKQFESASKLVQRGDEWRALQRGAVRDLFVFVPIYLVWGLAAAAMVGAAAPTDAGVNARPWWSRVARSRWTLAGAVVFMALADAIETALFHTSLTRLIETEGAGSIDSLVAVTQVFSRLKGLGFVAAVALLFFQVLTRPASTPLGIWREILRSRDELAHLQEPDPSREPVPLLAALVGSLVVAGLGNVVVLLGRRWCQADWTTLVGVPQIGALGIFFLCRRGWTRQDLGLQLPALSLVGPVSRGLLVTAVALALASAVLALLLRDHVTVLDVVRLLFATAIFEEVIHRGVVLGFWAGTGVSPPWIVLANMVTFALWHVAGAHDKDGFKILEVVGPGALAGPLLWARLRFRSVFAPAALHGVANMTATLFAGAPPTCTPCCITSVQVPPPAS
jgi:hypothetical protein